MKKRHAQRHGRAAALPAWLDARAAGLVLAVKALVLLYGAQAFVVWRDERLDSPYDWLAIWNRWDAPQYLDLARAGYVAEGLEARWIVFYPLYPWLVRAAASVLRDELLAAFFVSGSASVAAGVLLYGLARAGGESEGVARAPLAGRGRARVSRGDGARQRAAAAPRARVRGVGRVQGRGEARARRVAVAA